ncbi:MAG: hypothetical protein Q4G09_06395 [Clostridia bacterium]|nr:hypothetical protein [Clostridia bacterium]
MYINTESIEQFMENIEKDLNIINEYFCIQKQKKAIVFEGYNIIIMNSLKTHLHEWEELLSQASDISKYIDDNLEYLDKLQKDIKEINDLTLEVQLKKVKNENHDILLDEINNQYKKYQEEKNNILQNLILQNTQKIEEFNKKVICTIKKSIYKEDMFKTTNSLKTNTAYNQTKIKATPENEYLENPKKPSKKSNKTLLISEKDNKVYLPYLISDLEKELKEKKQYSNIEELIQNEYILDLDKFKNSMMARFKQAYNLIKKKEKKSIINATELGLELMFNYSLNPAIIAACKNEDELDIYLDCLEENELDSFKIFDVKYEISPVIKLV